MPPIRLIPEVLAPSGRGPGNGMFALQRALRARCPDWLKIGGGLRPGELPWFWSFADRGAILRRIQSGRPLVIGPNVVFQNSRRPRIDAIEAAILDAAACRMMFCHSAWYRDLLMRHRGPASRGPIVVWPYPIDPKPGGPMPAQYDLLLYDKGGPAELIEALRRRFPRSALVRYGGYRRPELLRVAARSRCCVYLSTDDHGPLALAEILLAGCPAIGVARGAPFIESGQTGVLLDGLDLASCLGAIDRCLAMDRHGVAALAARQFETGRILDTLLAALRTAAAGTVREFVARASSP